MAKSKIQGKPLDGPTNFYLTTDPGNGIIFINFEKSITWFALNAETAAKLGEQLIESSKQINKQRQNTTLRQ